MPCSGKTGEGIEDILEKIVTLLPAPKGKPSEDLKCLLVDSWYDTYLRSCNSSESYKWKIN